MSEVKCLHLHQRSICFDVPLTVLRRHTSPHIITSATYDRTLRAVRVVLARASAAPRRIYGSRTAPLPVIVSRFVGLCELAGALGLILPCLQRIRPTLVPLLPPAWSP